RHFSSISMVTVASMSAALLLRHHPEERRLRLRPLRPLPSRLHADLVAPGLPAGPHDPLEERGPPRARHHPLGDGIGRLRFARMLAPRLREMVRNAPST